MKLLKRKQPPPVWGWAQLREWAETVDRKLNLILAEVRDKGNVTEELERAVNKAWGLATKIDLKVPDRKTQLNKKKG